MNIDLYTILLTAMGILLFSAIAVPFAAAKRKRAGWLNFILVAAAGGLMLAVSYGAIFGQSLSTQLVRLGPLSVYFFLDGVSGFFLALISFMAVVSAFYSIEYMEHYPDYSLRSYYANYPLFILGMALIVTADDLTTGFTIAWQLMTVASFFLVRFEHRKPENVRAALKYLALMELAWALILGGALLIPGSAVGDSLHGLTAGLGTAGGVLPYVIYGLIFIGFGFKAAIFPLGQLWLPDAHSVAPSSISALLSGVMIKTGVYGIIRTFFWMVPSALTFHFDGDFWGIAIAVIGAVTLFIGTSQALKQHDAKRLHAYHSIGQMGYIVLGIGSSLAFLSQGGEFFEVLAVVALIGAVYHTLNHTVFKGLLFLTSGSILYATGSKDLNKLGGLMKRMPMTALIGGIASLSIAGIPCFSGFASKWTVISTNLLAGGHLVLFVVLGIIALFTSTLTLASYVKFFGMTFASSGAEWNVAKKIREVPFGMLLPKAVLAVLCVVQGLFPFVYYQFFIGIFRNSEGSIIQSAFGESFVNYHIFNSAMGVKVSVPTMMNVISSTAVPTVIFLVMAVAVVFAWLLRKSGGSTVREVPTWLCGYQNLDNLNRYPSKSMYAPVKKLLWWTGGNVK